MATGTAEQERKQRARARWRILRSALLGEGASSMTKEASIHRFEGFQMLSRRRLPNRDETSSEALPEEVFEFVEYEFPAKSSQYTGINIRVRERIKRDSRKIDIKALTSQRHYNGVDNTGNMCVWDSESTLAYCLLQHGLNQSPTIMTPRDFPNLISLVSHDRELHVVELGAGMAGLAGLALGAAGLNALVENVVVKVMLTDGHPDSVQNNLINAKLTETAYRSEKQEGVVDSSLLLWNDSALGEAECANLLTSNNNRSFDLCLASDCIHFQDFHAALMLTIARLLRNDGVAVLCQPHRGNSLIRFVQLLETVNDKAAFPLWQIRLLTDYDETMTLRRNTYLESDVSFDTSIHYPVLLVLRKLRALDEKIDRAVALTHMEGRDKLTI